MSRLPLSVPLIALASALAGQAPPAPNVRPAALAPAPADGEVALAAATGWRAFLIQQCPTGVWYAHVAKAIDAFGCPEVIATDDQGRLLVLSVYSGKWTAHAVTPDGLWLAPSRPADVDPRVPGREIYAAGKAGNVHRITLEPRPFAKYELRSVEIGHVAGEEFHTVLAADLAPERAGDELWAFAISGAVYELAAAGEAAADAFTMRKVATLPGRVRDAVVLATPGTSPRVIGASRSGHLLQLVAGAGSVETTILAHEPMGLGRVALQPSARAGAASVIYVTRDDGVLLRFEAKAGPWQRELIFAGAQGLRGVAAGRFHADAAREAVAVFGYGKDVQIVSRLPGEDWQVETIYTSPDQGHWLAVGELDGRNATDELIATGFGGQVVLLVRPPGFGLAGAAIDRAAAPAPRPRRSV